MDYFELKNFIITIVGFEGVLVFLAALLVFKQDITKRFLFFFFLLGVELSLWSMISSLYEWTLNDNLELFLVKTIYIVAGLIPPTLLFFSTSLSGGVTLSAKQDFAKLLFPYGVLVLIILSPNIFIKDIVRDSSINVLAKQAVFGPGYFYFILYVVSYTFFSSVALLREYKKSAGVFRGHLRAIFFAALVAVLSTLIVNIFLPIFGYFDFVWFGPTIGLITLAAIGYALIKSNFWNLKLILTEFFTYTLIILLFFEMLLVSTYLELLVKIIIFSIVLASGWLLVRSVRDETESRREVEKLLKDLEEVNSELTGLDKRKSEFLAISAHHLRDPLTAIKGYASMLLEGSFGTLNSSAQEALGKIFESSKRLVVIIEDFMNITQIEEGRMVYKFAVIDAKKMAKELVDEMMPSIKDSKLYINFDVNDNQEFFINADYGKIRQVISNIIDNAMKYTPEGGLNLSLTRTDKKILFKVEDTGIGMEQNTLKKIFKKFSRAEGANKVNTGGSGLGLYVAREIVKAHKGKIWAESEGLGKGSQFYVELDAVDTPALEKHEA